jgi:NitT/TauT family transport system substrate-binding protein
MLNRSGVLMLRHSNFIRYCEATNQFPLPSRERVRVREQARLSAPSPLSSPVEGEEVKLAAISRVRALFLMMALAILFFAAQADAQQREKVRVALGSISVNTAVIPVGQQAGLFTKHGIDLEPIYMGGGMNSLAAVTSNSVQFLAAGSTATISARLGGMDIIMLSVQSNQLEYGIYSAPDIKTVQDLKGKIVTGTRPGASADSALRLFLRKAGLEPGKDVVFISVGESQQGRLNALHRGSVAATALLPPFTSMAKQLGFHELADMRKMDIQYAGTAIAGMTSYIKSHPLAVENFLKGYVESLHYFRTQREKTIDGIMKFLKMSDRARAEEGYDFYVDLMPVMPYATPDGVKSVLQFLTASQPKAATAKPEEFYDMSFLKKIEGSGFTKSMAARR